MWSTDARSILNALAIGLAREGRNPADAVRLFTSPLKADSDEANRILAGRHETGVRADRNDSLLAEQDWTPTPPSACGHPARCGSPRAMESLP